MEQLYVFGTGNAAVSRCYNTCFAIREDDEYFMVDAGGGNGILGILERKCPLVRSTTFLSPTSIPIISWEWSG